jgi:DNA mismatch endonuclease, patch repair protein
MHCVDCYSSEVRSKVMRAVKSKGNQSTELRMIKLFRSYHISGWRRGLKMTGNPDFVFRRHSIVVFADGCFWHGHSCRNTKPKANSDYWKLKIARNVERDKKNSAILRRQGWKVFRFWECEIAKMNGRKIRSFLKVIST